MFPLGLKLFIVARKRFYIKDISRVAVGVGIEVHKPPAAGFAGNVWAPQRTRVQMFDLNYTH